jgi:hypothetical protein
MAGIGISSGNRQSLIKRRNNSLAFQLAQVEFWS